MFQLEGANLVFLFLEITIFPAIILPLFNVDRFTIAI